MWWKSTLLAVSFFPRLSFSGRVNGLWRFYRIDGTEDDGRNHKHAGTQGTPVSLFTGQLLSEISGKNENN